jgi:hypothetical protein
MTLGRASGSLASRAAPSAGATAAASVSAAMPHRQDNPLFGNVRNTLDTVRTCRNSVGLAVALINSGRPC